MAVSPDITVGDELHALFKVPDARASGKLLIEGNSGLRSKSRKERLQLIQAGDHVTISLYARHGRQFESPIVELEYIYGEKPRLGLRVMAVNTEPAKTPYSGNAAVDAFYYGDTGGERTIESGIGSTSNRGYKKILLARGCRSLNELPPQIDVPETMNGLLDVIAGIEKQAAQGDVPKSFMALFAQAYPALFNPPTA